MYEEDLALINLQWLICLKIKPNHELFEFVVDFYRILKYFKSIAMKPK